MEIGEIIGLPSPHLPEKCPFCPTPKDEGFVTHPGKKAVGTKLGQIMDDPTKLEGDARPKDGGADRQGKQDPKPKPNPPLSHPTFGPYSYEAHHLIPGSQKLLKPKGNGSVARVIDGHSIEQWICNGPNIKKDSGYSINNADNGVWLPSPPEGVKKLPGRDPTRPWERENHPKPHHGALTQAEKDEIADFAMDKGAGQFHYGHHLITDEPGSCSSYPQVVHDRLTQLERRIKAWSKECPFCGKKPSDPPYDPSWKVNELLDLVSMSIQIDIQLSGSQSWNYFISTHAKRYAKKQKEALAERLKPVSL